MSSNLNTTKASYNQPKLAVYGGFTQLTAAGSMNRPEDNVGQFAMRI